MNNYEKAIEESQKIDEQFMPDSIWETEDYIVLIDSRNGIPPIIVDRKTYISRRVVWGNKDDMDLVYKKAVFVKKVKG